MRITAAAITLLALLAGCGQTGPLYLPGEDPVRAGEPAPATDAGTAAESP